MSRLNNPTAHYINSFHSNSPILIQSPRNYDHEAQPDPESSVIVPPESIPQNLTFFETPPYEVLNFKQYFQNRFDVGAVPICAQGSSLPTVIEQSQNGDALIFRTPRRDVPIPNGPPGSPDAISDPDHGFFDFFHHPPRNTETLFGGMTDFKGTMTFIMRQATTPIFIQIKGLTSSSGETIFRFAKRTTNNKIQVYAILPASYGTWARCCQKNELAYIFRESFLCEARLSGSNIASIVNNYNENISKIRDTYSDTNRIPPEIIFDMGKILRSILLQEYTLCEHKDQYTTHICGSNHGLENLIRNKVNLSAYPHSIAEAAEFLDRSDTVRCYSFKESYCNTHVLPLHIPLLNSSINRKYSCKTTCGYAYSHNEISSGARNKNCITASTTGLCLHFTVYSFYHHHKSSFQNLVRTIKSRDIHSFLELFLFLNHLYSEIMPNDAMANENSNLFENSNLMPIFLPRELFLYGLIQQNSTPCLYILESKLEQEHERLIQHTAKRNVFQRSLIYLNTLTCPNCKRCKHYTQLSCCIDYRKMHFVKSTPIYRKCTLCPAVYNAAQAREEEIRSPSSQPQNGRILTDCISFFVFNEHCKQSASTFCLLLERISSCFCTIYKTEHRIFSVYLSLCSYFYPLLGRELAEIICSRLPLIKTIFLMSDFFTLSHELAHELLIANLELKAHTSEFAKFKANEIYARRAWEFEMNKRVFFEFLSTLSVGNLYLCTNRLVTYTYNLSESIQKVCNRKFAGVCRYILSVANNQEFRDCAELLPDLRELDQTNMNSTQFQDFCNSVSEELSEPAPAQLLADRFESISQYSLCIPHFLLNMKIFLSKKMGFHIPHLTEIEKICKIDPIQFFTLMNLSKLSIATHSQCNYDVRKSSYMHLYQHYLNRLGFLNIYNLFVEENTDLATKKMEEVIGCLTSEGSVSQAAEALQIMMGLPELTQVINHVHCYASIN